MDQSISDNDAKSLARAAHTLKGSAALFRAKRVVASASKLEASAKQEGLPQIAGLVDEVRSETTLLLEMLDTLA